MGANNKVKSVIIFLQMTMRQHWLGKTKYNLSDQSEALSKSCYGILKKIFFMEFSID